MWFKRPARDR